MAILIEFRLPAHFGARHVDVAGDFTAWAPLAMEQSANGDFRLRIQLGQGRRVLYRFLIDGEMWMNDPNADEYVTMPNGGAASVVHT